MSGDVKSVCYGRDLRVTVCVSDKKDDCAKRVTFCDENRDGRFDYAIDNDGKYLLSDKKIKPLYNEVKAKLFKSLGKAEILYKDLRSAIKSDKIKYDTACMWPFNMVRPYFDGIAIEGSFHFVFGDIIDDDGIYDTILLSHRGVQFVLMDLSIAQLSTLLEKINDKLSKAKCDNEKNIPNEDLLPEGIFKF